MRKFEFPTPTITFFPRLLAWLGIIILIALIATIAVVGTYIAKFGSNDAMHSFSEDPAIWGQFGDYIGGLLNPFFALINIVMFCLLTLAINHLQQKSEKSVNRERAVDRTIQLHKDYYESGFYERVRAPAYQVSMKWKLLPEKEQVEYRKEVSSGWTDADSVKKAAKYLNPFDPSKISHDIEHFHSRLEVKGLTEHQALSIYLRTWNRLWRLYENGVLDKKIFIGLFSDLFSYDREFFLELSKQVDTDIDPVKHRPGWIDAINKLDELFCGEI